MRGVVKLEVLIVQKSRLLIFTFSLFYFTEFSGASLQKFADLSMYKKSPIQIISKLKCNKEIKKLIYSGWKTKGEWVKKPNGTWGGVTLSSPTRVFSKWVQVQVEKDSIKTTLITPEKAIVVSWGEDCKRQAKVIAAAHKKNTNNFTDKELEDLVTKNKNGVIYFWGPNMPWSTLGIKEITEAANKLKLPIKVLRSPKSNAKVASNTLRDLNLNQEYVKTHQSLELLLRGSESHLPSIIIYKDGKLKRYVKPGHEFKEKFTKYLTKEFSK